MPGSLDHRHASDDNMQEQRMTGNIFVNRLAISLRRKLLFSAIVYAISVLVHLTSPGHGNDRHGNRATSGELPLSLRQIEPSQYRH
jgi:hypothetical protein